MRRLAVRALVAAAILGIAPGARAKLYRYPLASDKGTITAYFDHSGKDWGCGTKRYTGHKGTDYGAAKGTPIYAAASGSVVYTNDGCSDSCTTGSCGCGGGFGNYVKLRHDDGKHTYYAHMQIWSVKVKTGQNVSCGQLLGNLASSGNSTGNHIHFEVRAPTTSTDPFAGSCAGATSLWVQQGAYLGRPGTGCAQAPKPDTGPPPKLDKGVPPKLDKGVPPKQDTGVPPKQDTGVPKKDTGTPKKDTGAPPPRDGTISDTPPVMGDRSALAHGLTGGCAISAPAVDAWPAVLIALALALTARRRARPRRRRPARRGRPGEGRW